MILDREFGPNCINQHAIYPPGRVSPSRNNLTFFQRTRLIHGLKPAVSKSRFKIIFRGTQIFSFGLLRILQISIQHSNLLEEITGRKFAVRLNPCWYETSVSTQHRREFRYVSQDYGKVYTDFDLKILFSLLLDSLVVIVGIEFYEVQYEFREVRRDDSAACPDLLHAVSKQNTTAKPAGKTRILI